MRRFATLFEDLDSTNSSNRMEEVLVSYFDDADAEDAAWVVYFLSGNRLKRTVQRSSMKEWIREQAELPTWLYEECYGRVGDTAELIALLAPDGEPSAEPVHVWAERLQGLASCAESVQKRKLRSWWEELSTLETFILNKMLTGAFRVGVSERTVVDALSSWTGVDASVLSHRLAGSWEPSADAFNALIDPDTEDADAARPYPFMLAAPLDSVEELSDLGDWVFEWKWDGFRAQVVCRDEVTVWSRRHELITEEFPEVVRAAQSLPSGTVLDGELVAWDDGPLPFSVLQRRKGRSNPTRKIQRQAPVVFVVFDVLEWEGEDVRDRAFSERRSLVEELDKELIRPSDIVSVSSVHEAKELWSSARERKVEGFLVKRRDSTYSGGRERGTWWKWKVDPLELDTVLMYAQMGHGKRANLHSDYTLGVWDGEDLVPIGKAYSGLTDEELEEMDAWIRSHTVEKYGPVRSVEQGQVFELHFDGIVPSPQRKAGMSLRFPRIARWRRDLDAEDADSLEAARALMEKFDQHVTSKEQNASLDEFL